MPAIWTFPASCSMVQSASSPLPWLRRQGHRHARKRIARLLRAAGLRGRTPRRWNKTTVPDPAAAARADLIRGDVAVNAAAVNTRWCGDITSIPTWEGWL